MHMAKLIIKSRYGVVPNQVLNDPRLSLKAKGLFAYLQSKPEDWSFSLERIATQTKDQIDGVRTAVHELERFGFLKRSPFRNPEGLWAGYNYILLDSPSLDLPTTVLPTLENGDTLSNKDSSKKEVVNKTHMEGWERFWKAYPRKIAKPAALRAWNALRLTDGDVDKVLAGLDEWKASDQWERDGGRYIPHPATFLNQHRWEDEVPKKEVSFISFNK